MKKAIFMFVVLISSCDSSTEEIEELELNIIDKFPEPIALEGVKIPIEEDSVFKPYYIEFIDSSLVVSTFTDGKLIAIYDKNGRYIVSFGRLGNGPNELNDYSGIYDHQIEGQTMVTTFDVNLLTLDKINLTKSIATNNLIIEETYEFPKELRRVSTAFLLDSNKIIGVYEGQFYKNLDQRTGLYNFNTESQEFEIFKLPNIDFKPSDPTNFKYGHFVTRLNIRRSDLSLSNTHLAVVMRYIPLLQVFKIEDNSFNLIGNYYLNGEYKNQVFKMDYFEENRYSSYYPDLTVSEDYVYLLKNVNQATSDALMEAQIQVLNWVGEPKAVYEISSNYDIDAITVNEADSIFYGLSYSQDAIYKFDYSSAQ